MNLTSQLNARMKVLSSSESLKWITNQIQIKILIQSESSKKKKIDLEIKNYRNSEAESNNIFFG